MKITMEQESIVAWIKDYVMKYQARKHSETAWREPLVGFADATDPQFKQLKKVISPKHALPTDFIEEAKSVIAYFLPYHENIVYSNLKGKESSRAWDMAEIESCQLIDDINEELFGQFIDLGFTSSKIPATYDYDEETLYSNWSHRHVANIAGLGTFGIHNLLITDKGCCGVIGSLVTDMPLNPTAKIDREYCIYKVDGKCTRCVTRCVAKAMSTNNGFPYVDIQKCNAQIYNGKVPQYENGQGDTCGKCMCGVPCSTRNPLG